VNQKVNDLDHRSSSAKSTWDSRHLSVVCCTSSQL